MPAKPKKCLLLWGSSGAYGDDGSEKVKEYKLALELMENLACGNGFELHLVQYPGHPTQDGKTEGRLSFHVALRQVLIDCARFQPEWIIGRSFGALLAPAALSSGEGWVKTCKGAVMWGPGFKRFNDKIWGTPEQKAQAVRNYQNFQTHLATDFFDTLPEVESLVPTAQSNLRFVRGSQDAYNTTEDLQTLERLHKAAQPTMKREMFTLDGFDHTPTRNKLSNQQIEQYSKCLFRQNFADT